MLKAAAADIDFVALAHVGAIGNDWSPLLTVVEIGWMATSWSQLGGRARP
jgi:hypothetical protein